MHIAAVLVFFSFLGWVYLALFHGKFWLPLLADPAIAPTSWPSIDIVVPARNEAEILQATLAPLLDQDYPGQWRVLLVDDNSTDGTADMAQRLAAKRNLSEKLVIVKAPALADGWSGKVAAMNAGVQESSADYILFTDADINHHKKSLREIAMRAIELKLDLVSRMVKLHCVSSAEKLLIPAFVFFFSMLYPFRRVNYPDSGLAAAAGGVMLVRRKALDNIGGLARIKGALIDDCALATAIKNYGGEQATEGKIEIAMTRKIKSERRYPDIRDIWEMVSRTAFTQLNYSPILLIGTIAGLCLLFLVPVLLPIASSIGVTGAALFVWLMMSALYLPMVRFYDLPVVWALTLPAAAVIYILATIDSARLYWQGKGGQWKGRVQA